MLSDRYVRLAREAGALGELPRALAARAYVLLFTGELTAAASLVAEMQAAVEATGSNLAPYAALSLAAFGGHEDEAAALTEATLQNALPRGDGFAISAAGWTNAVLNNGLGHYGKALDAARRTSENHAEVAFANWAVSELIEAAVRSGQTETDRKSVV